MNRLLGPPIQGGLLALPTNIRPERPAGYKHCSSLLTFVNYDCKKLYNIGPGANRIKLFTAQLSGGPL